MIDLKITTKTPTKTPAECKTHGLTVHTLKTSGHWRCNRCAVESVDRARKKKKRILIEEAGGKCVTCGYNKCHRALGFHHRDPTTKEFDLSDKARSYSLERLRKEAAKCDLMCGNCHMEREDETTTQRPPLVG